MTDADRASRLLAAFEELGYRDVQVEQTPATYSWMVSHAKPEGGRQYDYGSYRDLVAVAKAREEMNRRLGFNPGSRLIAILRGGSHGSPNPTASE